jgi:hypothetical protein
LTHTLNTLVEGARAQRDTHLKLEAQKIKDFGGAHDDWAKWKSCTECTFSGSGYEQVLDNFGYATAHPRLNKVVYLQLASATVDGVVYHLVQKFETDKDGHAAWKNRCEWYVGKTVKSETAVGIRSKLEALQLTTSTSGSDYVNKFLAWHCDLEKIKGEGMLASHAVSVFLRNITDPDYQTTVTFCLNSDALLDNCINAIRKQERKSQRNLLDTNLRLRCVV